MRKKAKKKRRARDSEEAEGCRGKRERPLAIVRVRALSLPNGLCANTGRESLCSKPEIYAGFTSLHRFIIVRAPHLTPAHPVAILARIKRRRIDDAASAITVSIAARDEICRGSSRGTKGWLGFMARAASLSFAAAHRQCFGDFGYGG